MSSITLLYEERAWAAIRALGAIKKAKTLESAKLIAQRAIDGDLVRIGTIGFVERREEGEA